MRVERNDGSIACEAPLDGIYIIRTSAREDAVSAADVVRTYKSLGHVEQAFRCLKGVDLRVRPIRHRSEAHVRAHIFLCVLAYCVEHQLRAAQDHLQLTGDGGLPRAAAPVGGRDHPLTVDP